MISQHSTGGAAALPIARQFLEIGGRIMLSPEGKVETGGNLACFFLDSDPREARRSFTIGRRLHRRLKDPPFARSVAAMLAAEGEPVNGWLVMRGPPFARKTRR